MPNGDALIIRSYPQRKAAVLRAAQLISSPPGSDSELEFEMLTEAIADFDIRQKALDYVEIPRAFVRLLASRYREGWLSAEPRRQV